MISIDYTRQKCIGCNACVENLRSRWRISKVDGKSVLLGSSEKKGIFTVLVDETELEKNKTVAKNCPVHIIKVHKV